MCCFLDLPAQMDMLCPCTNIFPSAYAHVRTEPLARCRPHSRKKKGDSSTTTLLSHRQALSWTPHFMRKLLFKLLGINFASEGSKAPPFSDCFKTLGLVVDTENVGNREVKVGHTEERSKELLECIDEILSHNSVGTKTWKDCMAG